MGGGIVAGNSHRRPESAHPEEYERTTTFPAYELSRYASISSRCKPSRRGGFTLFSISSHDPIDYPRFFPDVTLEFDSISHVVLGCSWVSRVRVGYEPRTSPYKYTKPFSGVKRSRPSSAEAKS